MDEQDAFFTQAVVGAPFSVLLGRQMSAASLQAQGVEVQASAGLSRLGEPWQPWAIERTADLPAGVPRARPRGLRRWLERHALPIALLGLASLATGALLAAHAQGWLAPLLRRLPW
ncbi:MAG: hypothetical protein IBJ14_06230 [Hydrogenophaga sp.]|nr:hypothetical protein [Hydrogenophaga sp.]